MDFEPTLFYTLLVPDCNLGLVYIDQAIAKYKHAIWIDPNHTSAHYNLACMYSLKNETALAIGSLQKAISMDARWIELSKTDSDFDNSKLVQQLGKQQVQHILQIIFGNEL